MTSSLQNTPLYTYTEPVCIENASILSIWSQFLDMNSLPKKSSFNILNFAGTASRLYLLDYSHDKKDWFFSYIGTLLRRTSELDCEGRWAKEICNLSEYSALNRFWSQTVMAKKPLLASFKDDSEPLSLAEYMAAPLVDSNNEVCAILGAAAFHRQFTKCPISSYKKPSYVA